MKVIKKKKIFNIDMDSDRNGRVGNVNICGPLPNIAK